MEMILTSLQLHLKKQNETKGIADSYYHEDCKRKGVSYMENMQDGMEKLQTMKNMQSQWQTWKR